MPAVTQRIPNYLGGVSKQSDEKLLNNQVRECINGFPDPTYGLVKRSGNGFLTTLDTAAELEDAKWFFYQRDGEEAYFGAIKDKKIRMWNAFTFVEGTVTITGGDYLDTTKEHLDVLSVQDTTIITNQTVVVETEPAPTYVAKKQGTVRLLQALFDSEYVVTINSQQAKVTTPAGTSGTVATAEDILTDLKKEIDDLNISSLVVTKLNSTLELKCNNPITLDSRGGPNNDLLVSFLDEVNTVADLPAESVQDRIVKVINSSQTVDDEYFVEFKATDGVKGKGFWEEAKSPAVSTGLVNSTMPHELKSTGVDTFTFGPIDWTKRLTGDLKTNPNPSFVDNKISKVFFYNTRLGVLSSDNVILSQTGEFYNFFNVSALVQVDSDPVDVSVQSIKPARLFSCIPVTQGLALFSRGQQFMLYADNGILTPGTTIIRTISYYEMDVEIEPVDVGTNITFVSKSPISTQAYGMVTRGQDDNPIVVELSKVVSEYLPSTLEDMLASPQNSLIALYSSKSSTVYFYRTYNNGEKDLMQSWFKWELPGTVQSVQVINDLFFFVTIQADQTTLSKIAIDQIPNRAVVIPEINGSPEIIGNPCIDMFAQATQVTYDLNTKESKCYLPYNNIDALTPIIYLANETADNPIDAGWYVEPEEVGSDANGDYFLLKNQDLSVVADRVIVGYRYALEVDLPTIYYRSDEINTDYTASLIIGRMKFACGLNGSLGVKLKSKGRDEWVTVQPTSLADYYLASTTPIVGSQIFVVPINQRSTYFNMKIYCDTPYPVSLNSMMWEGNYSPKFYRRK